MLITFMLASGPSVDCPSLQAGLIFILLADGGDGGEGEGGGGTPLSGPETCHTSPLLDWPNINHSSVTISDISASHRNTTFL